MKTELGETLLRKIQQNDAGIEIVQQFRAEYPEVEWNSLIYRKSGDTILHVCARLGLVQIMQYVINNWPPPRIDCRNNDFKTPLHEAAQFSQPEIVKVLLRAGAQVDSIKKADWTPLMLASTKIGKNSYQVIETLLSYGASVTRANKDGWLPLHLACRAGDINIVRILFFKDKRSAHVLTRNKRTLLHISCLHGHFDITELLLKYINNVSAKDVCGNTPLHDAVCSGNISLINLLLLHGSDILSVNNVGFSCLHLAASEGMISMVKFLICEKKMDANMTTWHLNLTALHCAARKKQEKTVEVLLELGADSSIKDSYGRLANDYMQL